MTLAEVIQRSGKTRKHICQKAEIPYSTLADLISGRKDILRVQTRTFANIACALSLSMDKFYDMLTTYECSLDYAIKICSVDEERCGVKGDVYLYDIEYYVAFPYRGKTRVVGLGESSGENRLILSDMARFTMYDIVTKLMLQEGSEKV